MDVELNGLFDIDLGKEFGNAQKLGNGMLSTFVELTDEDVPETVSVRFTAGMLEALPTTPTYMHHCFDVNGDDIIVNTLAECIGGHERALEMPEAMTRNSVVTFDSTLIKWNGTFT